MGRGFVLSCAALLAALMLAGCDLVAGDPTPTYRYRMTVEVETPEGLETGSSVIEVSTDVAGKYSIPTPGRVSHRVRGEAAAVDLGERGVLFALLRSESEVDWSANVMFLLAPAAPDAIPAGESFLWRYDAMLAMTRPIELPATFPDVAHLKDRPARPMLVTFRDLADPTTVEKVDPDNLAASFGDGVSLRRITVQMTDDPVTTGIEERLEWMDEYRNRHFDDSSTVSEDLTTDDLAARLSAGSFSTDFAR